uniref:DnaJ (Hsp40) homolog, subfamily C, member 15 n=1 Tax=Salmo trutta TaxID=8032 RepID=A0A674CML4_SALTR
MDNDPKHTSKVVAKWLKDNEVKVLEWPSQKLTSLLALQAFSSHHYKGGFDQNMTKNEASLILGISPTSTKSKVRDAHRRIMVLNHPDKGQFNPKVLDMINYRLDIGADGSVNE